MKQYKESYYRIGDVILKVENDFPYEIPDTNMSEFQILPEEEDYLYRFEKVTDIPALVGPAKIVKIIPFGYEMLDSQEKHIRGFHWRERYYDAVLRIGKTEGIISYVSHVIMSDRCIEGCSFTNYFALEILFLRFGILLLHSSHINIGGRALLFSAPSGTGKSTQADLWAKYAGAEIINGDRSLLRKKDGAWHAYGCPMCGTSGIHKQGNEPIHAIVMLSQGTENAVRRLSAGEAFQRMYPEITVPKWNRELVLRAMELLDDVMANVPIYAFSCTKDESAVTALREALGL